MIQSCLQLSISQLVFSGQQRYQLKMAVEPSTVLVLWKDSKVTFGSFTCRKYSLPQDQRDREILQSSQALKPLLEETTVVKCKVVEDTSI